MNRDLIGIVIPCHNRRDITLNCLKNLRSIQREGFDTRIYLVDDGSTDGTSEAVRSIFGGEVNILKGDGSLFWTGAVNRGIAQATKDGCDFIHLLNDDTQFRTDFLAKLYQFLLDDRNAIVGSIVCDQERPTRVIRGGFVLTNHKFIPWLEKKGPLSELSSSGPYQVDSLSGTSTLIPRQVMEKIGVFDSRRFPHAFADIDYFLRARKAGLKLFVEPQSIVLTKIELKYHRFLLDQSRPRAITELWFNNRFFGIRTMYNLSKYSSSPILYIAYQLLKKLKWTAYVTLLGKSQLRRELLKAKHGRTGGWRAI